MTRLGLWECFILLAFWLGGLAAYLLGGLVWVGHVVQGFLWAVFFWVLRQLFLEYWDTLTEKYRRQVLRRQINAAFKEWDNRRTHRMKGME